MTRRLIKHAAWTAFIVAVFFILMAILDWRLGQIYAITAV